MAGRECYHCKQWVDAGEPHNCWSTTEAALTSDLPTDLREAWERLRETAAAFGEQRIYASLNSIMFSRTACYLFVRPKLRFLEVCFFLGRTVNAPQIKRAQPASRRKTAHLVQVRHRDEVEPPLTEWMREVYEMSDALSGRGTAAAVSSRHKKPRQPRTLKTTTTDSPPRQTARSRGPARARSKRG